MKPAEPASCPEGGRDLDTAQEVTDGQAIRTGANPGWRGAGRPRFALVATQGTDVEFYQVHLRRKELEALAAAVGAEIVYLPAAGPAGEEEKENEGGGRRGGRRHRAPAE